jgi:hypothetical protein
LRRVVASDDGLRHGGRLTVRQGCISHLRWQICNRVISTR